jgi:hypothetical protein
MTRKEYLNKLTNELHYDEERLRVVVEIINANPVCIREPTRSPFSNLHH